MIKETKEGLLVSIRVKPKSHRDEVECIDDQYITIRTRSIPEKGNANDSVIKILSEFFSIPKSHIEIVSGTTAKLKNILIPLKYADAVKDKIELHLNQ